MTDQRTSKGGLDYVAREEGCVLKVYPDQCGIDTIGIGHRLKPGESFPNGITRDQALDMLAKDIATAEAEINRDVKVPLTQNQFDALVDFTFNCGNGAMHQSSTLTKLNAGDYQGAADALLLWDKGMVHGHLVDLGVLRDRRTADRALFLKPDAPSDPITGEIVSEVLDGTLNRFDADWRDPPPPVEG